MADMPSCNLSETIHKKWLQQSGNRANDLFAAIFDEMIRAIMQMTNYRAYLKGKTYHADDQLQSIWDRSVKARTEAQGGKT
jgi:hypothetical protein